MRHKAVFWRRAKQDVCACLLSLLIVGMSLALIGMLPARAATSQLYWSDPHSGIAIGGYDPVAYFVDGRPRAGSPDFELQWAGGTWRFVNEGNREVFRRDPQVYAPRFGGYDPLQIVRGYIAPGNPLIWTVRQQRLYLFITIGQREQWPRNDAMTRLKVQESWSRLRRTLVKK
ncbi:MAG: YHS domain-containing (seleno)protein [Hyphomicrobiales bacterium]